jgi:GNAT superfamily N-acetyltransferase
VTSDLARAERALSDRMLLAGQAAAAAGVPGPPRVWEQDGLLAVSAGHPALAHLATISGVTEGNVAAAVELAYSAVWDGARPTILPTRPGAVEAILLAGGLTRGPDRMLALRRLGDGTPAAEPGVVPAVDTDGFMAVLLAGYEVGGAVAAFIDAEHRAAAVSRFLVDRTAPVAAGAMTVHGDVVVVGGAATLPAHRGTGAQSALLRHRLAIAARAGCTLAVATAEPDSTSAANLRRAGFRTVRRAAWTAGPTGCRPGRW